MCVTKHLLRFIAAILLLFSVSCTGLHQEKKGTETVQQYVSAQQDSSLLAKFAPLFLLEDANKSFNRIGTPAVRKNADGKPEAYVDPSRPTIYTMEQKFKGKKGEYKNLIFRVHFERTPFKHLTAGNNVGLFVIVTLNQNDLPVLITSVHSCGCYLAITPTSWLSPKSYPANWPLNGQKVYGEDLPSLIEMGHPADDLSRFVFQIRGGTHRVMNLALVSENNIPFSSNFMTAPLRPMDDLRKLPFGDSEISFFETAGSRKGYVRNSHKPFERLLMSWWAMDWRVGEDKDLGPSKRTGTTFYTSLKFWAREQSDLWNFANFLEYWGWNL